MKNGFPTVQELKLETEHDDGGNKTRRAERQSMLKKALKRGDALAREYEREAERLQGRAGKWRRGMRNRIIVELARLGNLP